MKNIQFNVIEEVELNNPILLEALPGVGNVGKLVADHMIEELDATKFIEIYSPGFPPQVVVGENGLIEPMVNELYYIKSLGEDGRDIILLVGNTQGLSPESQYELCGSILDYVESCGTKEVLTLGGFVSNKHVEEPRVVGAATDMEKIEYLKKFDVEIRESDGGIVGASGLLLGLAKLRKMSGACLMGETPGYFVDAGAAEALLIKLMEVLNFEINTDKLEETAEETRKLISQAQEDVINSSINQDEDLRYIG